MTLPDDVPTPDAATITRFMTTLFGPVQRHYPQGLIEICYGRIAPSTSAYFNMSNEGLDSAISFVKEKNLRRYNVYVGVNPRKPETDQTESSFDKDIEISFFHFADIDKAEAVERAKKQLKLAPDYVVTTGTKPSERPHLYWELDEPVMNMEAWREQQRAIAAATGGDSVIDPRRVMRVAGTVNYPTEKKAKKGYAVELITFRTVDRRGAPQSSFETIAAAFPLVSPESNVIPINREGMNNLAAMAQDKTEALIAACLAGDEWHNNMIRLVARLARLGRTDTEIMLYAAGITLPGYTVADTEREMRKALEGARAKHGSVAVVDVENDATVDGIYEALSIADLRRLPPPTYLIDGLVPEYGLTTVYGEPGAGKSFIVLDMALRIANGMDWHGGGAKKGGVLYIAGEGKHGMGKRIDGWYRQHGADDTSTPFRMVPVAVPMLDPASVAKLNRTIDHHISAMGGNVALVVIDTVSRAMAGADENKQDAMSLFVNGCADIQNHIGGAVIGVHHSGKDSERGMRGSSVLLGACEGVLRLSKMGSVVEVRNEKQKDDEAAADTHFEMRKVEWASGFDSLSTLVPERVERGPIKGRQKLAPSVKLALEQLVLTIESEGFAPPASIPENAINCYKVGRVCSLQKWEVRTNKVVRSPDTKPDSSERMFRRERNKLQELGIIGVYEDYVWLTHE